MEYATITDEEKAKELADAIAAREREHWGYSLNVERFRAMLAALPAERPECEADPASMTEADVVAWARWNLREELRGKLRDELYQRARCEAVLDALRGGGG